jgi:regulator of protease activity HflC (stomatin/prohibitin superfamily)
MRLQQLNVSCETKTKDNVFVVLKVAIQYQVVSDPQSIKDSFYRLSQPRQQIESYVYDVVRSTVPKIELDDVFTTKEEISHQVASSLKHNMASFGYQILGTPITDIDPDPQVRVCGRAASRPPLCMQSRRPGPKFACR